MTTVEMNSVEEQRNEHTIPPRRPRPRVEEIRSDTVVVSQGFEGDVQDLAAYCRSLQSRTNWPGAVLEWETPDTLYYSVGMRLKAATMTDIDIEERLGEIGRSANGGLRFKTAQRVTWPDGHADASCEYVFTPGTEGGQSTVQLTYSYPPPSHHLVKPKQRPAFRAAMEGVARRYLEQLTAGLPRGAAA